MYTKIRIFHIRHKSHLRYFALFLFVAWCLLFRGKMCSLLNYMAFIFAVPRFEKHMYIVAVKNSGKDDCS